ncbi:hypothetical protein C5F59_038005 [Streptomyces sp. QL37]|nr:hypothetical protein [Streptomyces sp. QL37]
MTNPRPVESGATGVDLARGALRAAMEQARKTGPDRKSQRMPS